MTKRKLQRFNEILTFPHVIQQESVYPRRDHEFKGSWHKKFFHNDHPIVLELGCGRGEYTIALAEKYPDRNFIGVDWKGARLWRGAKTSFENQMKNVAFLRIQIQNISNYFSEGEVEEIWITFPDPQIQKSRERKRLTSARFLDEYRKFLIPEGLVNLKTDSLFLFEYTFEVLTARNISPVQHSRDLYGSQLKEEILGIHTTYEKIWLAEGAKICYLQFMLQ